VRSEPPDFDHAGLARLLEREWSFPAVSLDYLPVGFGSHHWAAADAEGRRRFVTVDHLGQARLGADAFDTLRRAFQTAALLRDEAGLEFVVGPLADRAGAPTNRLGDYAVTVFPFLEERSRGGEPDEVMRMLDRLHAATVPQDLPRREDFAIPNRDALRALDRPWTTGPFGEPARALLRSAVDRLAEWLDEYDELARVVGETSDSWVVTHGEPHSSNVIRDDADGLFLVDWDTVMLAPRERDLWMVVDSDDCATRLYRSRWVLADVAEFIHVFRRPHERTADTITAWNALKRYLEN
jgi:spectinomycin phosphotransferase